VDKIGGPLGIFIILGLLDTSMWTIAISVLVLSSIAMIIYSTIRPSRIRDLVILSVSGLIFMIPMIFQLIAMKHQYYSIYYIYHHLHYFRGGPFIFTFLLFFTLFSVTFFKVLKNKVIL
jgi:hypothetical protein